jgi:hypothetical protein
MSPSMTGGSDKRFSQAWPRRDGANCGAPRTWRPSSPSGKLVAEQAARLIASPGLGRPGREPGTRELVIHRIYILIFEVQEMNVPMLRILHAACRGRHPLIARQQLYMAASEA